MKNKTTKACLTLLAISTNISAAQAAPIKSSDAYLAEIKNSYNQLLVPTTATVAMNLLIGPKQETLNPAMLDKQAQTFELQKNAFKAACLYMVEADRLSDLSQTLKSSKVYSKALSLIPLMKAEEKYFFANLLALYEVPQTKDLHFGQSWRAKFRKQANLIAQSMSTPSTESKLLRANILRYASREDLDNIDAEEIKTEETARLDKLFEDQSSALAAPPADEIVDNRKSAKEMLEAENFQKAIELADQNIALISKQHGQDCLRLVPDRCIKFEAYTRAGKAQPGEAAKAMDELESINAIVDRLPAFPNLELRDRKSFHDNDGRIKRTLMAFDAALGWQPKNKEAEIKAEVIRYKLDLKMFSGPDGSMRTISELAERFKKRFRELGANPQSIVLFQNQTANYLKSVELLSAPK